MNDEDPLAFFKGLAFTAFIYLVILVIVVALISIFD